MRLKLLLLPEILRQRRKGVADRTVISSRSSPDVYNIAEKILLFNSGMDFLYRK